MDIVVRAFVNGPIAGFRGIGTIQSFESALDEDQSVWIPYPGASQIYVPGLLEKDPSTGKLIYTLALSRVEQTKIGWDPS